MPWLKVDDHMSCHPATAVAGDSALGLWLRLGCWLVRFPEQIDEVPEHVARRQGSRRQIDRLIEAELLIKTETGYRLNNSLAIAGSGLPGRSWMPDSAANSSRRPIPAALRAKVYDRDGRACVQCGATQDLALDHIYPHSLGGEDTYDNLRTLCRSCNSRKGGRV